MTMFCSTFSQADFFFGESDGDDYRACRWLHEPFKGSLVLRSDLPQNQGNQTDDFLTPLNRSQSVRGHFDRRGSGLIPISVTPSQAVIFLREGYYYNGCRQLRVSPRISVECFYKAKEPALLVLYNYNTLLERNQFEGVSVDVDRKVFMSFAYSI